MDITVYLPDELGKWAKDGELNLSRMLRDAVEDEKRRRDARAALKAEAKTHELAVSKRNGYGGIDDDYTVRLHGTLIAKQYVSGLGDINVYQGQDGKLYVHYAEDGSFYRDVEVEGVAQHVDESTYIEAMRALGEEVVIDVGLPE